jgi:hypothetical protein
MHAHYIGRQEVHRLAEHAGLRLDAANAPANHAQAIDHGGVAVGADQRVRIVQARPLVHAARKIFQIHLVHDADARRHHLERGEGLHAPLQEPVTLGIALEFHLHVEIERVGGVVVVDLDRVVDHQIDRHQRLDPRRILAEPGGGAAHGREIAQQRHAGEILQKDAGDDEGNLRAAGRVGLPAGELPDMCLGDLVPVAVAHQRFQNDAQRHRQPFEPELQRFRQRGQRM